MEKKAAGTECLTEECCNTRRFEAVCTILQKYDRNPENLIPILQEIQEQYRYLPREVMTFVANALDINPARVYGVATFYAHFALEPKGKYVIRICDGTACHVKGAGFVAEKIGELLGIKEGETTADGQFSFRAARCLGMCAMAPVLMVDEKVYGSVTPEMVEGILRDYGYQGGK